MYGAMDCLVPDGNKVSGWAHLRSKVVLVDDPELTLVWRSDGESSPRRWNGRGCLSFLKLTLWAEATAATSARERGRDSFMGRNERRVDKERVGVREGRTPSESRR